MKAYEGEVRTREDALAFIRWAAGPDGIGMGFHPDDGFADYTDGRGARLFTAEQAKTLDAKLDAACGFLDQYEESLKVWRSHGWLPEGA